MGPDKDSDIEGEVEEHLSNLKNGGGIEIQGHEVEYDSDMFSFR